MKFSKVFVAASLLFGAASLASLDAHAQKTIAGAVQQGNGAYVQKNTRNVCISNTLLGLPGLDCLDMTQTKYMVTPSGNITSVWRGTAPASARPAQQKVFKSTYAETQNGVTANYDTEAVADANGTVTLTLRDKHVEGYKKANMKH